METNSIGSVTITRPVASGSSHNDAPWEKPSQDSVGHILHHCWHWSGHLRDTRILLTLVRAPAGYPHHCWGHLQGTCILLTLVRAPAEFPHHCWHWWGHMQGTCILLTLVGAPAGYPHHCWRWSWHLRGICATADNSSVVKIRIIIIRQSAAFTPSPPRHGKG